MAQVGPGFAAQKISGLCQIDHVPGAVCGKKNGEQVSKRQATLWARDRFPEQARLIERALEWREAEDDKGIDHEATFSETERFVNFMIDQVETVFECEIEKWT